MRQEILITRIYSRLAFSLALKEFSSLAIDVSSIEFKSSSCGLIGLTWKLNFNKIMKFIFQDVLNIAHLMFTRISVR